MTVRIAGGTATPAELAAVLAAVTAATSVPRPPGPYERWRYGRIAALRRSEEPATDR